MAKKPQPNACAVPLTLGSRSLSLSTGLGRLSWGRGEEFTASDPFVPPSSLFIAKTQLHPFLGTSCFAPAWGRSPTCQGPSGAALPTYLGREAVVWGRGRGGGLRSISEMLSFWLPYWGQA